MRVVVVNKFWYRRGGAEVVALAHDQILRERGHALSHFAMSHPENLPSPFARYFPSRVELGADAGLPGPRELLRPFYSREVDARLCQLLDAERPEVAVVHNAYHQLGATALAVLARRDVPIVQVLHDYKPVCPSYTNLRDGRACSACAGGRFFAAARHGCGGSRAAGLVLAAEAHWQWRVARTYPRVTRWVAPSHYLARRFAELGFPYPIDHLPNPAPAPAPGPPVDRAGSRRIGYAGRLSPEKGVDLLAEVGRQHPDLEIRIAGDGPERAALERASPANVRFLGWLPRAELETEMRTWRLAVLPSRWAENAPMAALDALSAGLPLVVSDLGGTAELIGDAGIAVPPRAGALAEAIAELSADDRRIAELGARGRRRAETLFGREAVGDALERVIGGALAQAG